MNLLGRKLYQCAVLVILAALVTNCGLLWAGPKSNTSRDGNLGLTLWVSRGRSNVGQPVKIRFTVENPTDQTEVIQLEEKPVMDIQIRFGTMEHGTTLYWSDGREITPEMRRLELAPGESKTVEMIWVPDEKADGGPVLARAILRREHSFSSVRLQICVGTCGIH